VESRVRIAPLEFIAAAVHVSI